MCFLNPYLTNTTIPGDCETTINVTVFSNCRVNLRRAVLRGPVHPPHCRVHRSLLSGEPTILSSVQYSRGWSAELLKILGVLACNCRIFALQSQIKKALKSSAIARQQRGNHTGSMRRQCNWKIFARQ